MVRVGSTPSQLPLKGWGVRDAGSEIQTTSKLMHLPVYMVSMERDKAVRHLPRLSEIIFSLSNGVLLLQSLIRECQKEKKKKKHPMPWNAFNQSSDLSFFKIYSLLSAHLKTWNKTIFPETGDRRQGWRLITPEPMPPHLPYLKWKITFFPFRLY